MIKKYRGYILFYYIAFIITLIAASLYDLEIDKALNNPKDPFSNWFYFTGEMPGKILMPFAGLFIYYFGEKKISKYVGLLFTIGGSIYFGFYSGTYIFRESENKKMYMIFCLIYGLGYGLFLLTIGKYIKIPDKIKKPVVMAGYAGIAATFIQLGIIEGSKIIWGRVRFRDLLSDGSFDRFTPWYHPNGINGNKSFPSGHTAGAGISYIMMLLPSLSEKYKNKFALCFAVPFVYTSIVAYTRLVMGAHYLSDVAVGGTVSFTIVVVMMAIMDYKNKNILQSR